MKRKLKIMNHQIDQLKEEITSKEAALVKEHQIHQKVEKQKDALKAELQEMKKEAAESKAYIEQQEAEERKLLKIISEADAERLRQKKELDQVVSERDILGTQLVRRNDELALLYEKIKIQQSTLDKGFILIILFISITVLNFMIFFIFNPPWFINTKLLITLFFTAKKGRSL